MASNIRKMIEEAGMTSTVINDDVTRRTKIETDLTSLLKVIDNAERLSFRHAGNTAQAKNRLGKGSQGYARLMAGLHGNQDMTEFLRRKDELARGGLLDKIQTKLGSGKPRVRMTPSDMDGDFDLSRKHDFSPRWTIQKERTLARTLRIDCHFAARGGDPDSLNHFGTFAWAIADMIENAGVLTEVNYIKVNSSVEANTPPDGRSWWSEIRTNLKQCHDYVNPQVLAAAFTEEFYQKANWFLIPIACDIANFTNDPHIGSPKSPPNAISFADGVLSLSSDANLDMGRVEKEIFTALGI